MNQAKQNHVWARMMINKFSLNYGIRKVINQKHKVQRWSTSEANENQHLLIDHYLELLILGEERGAADLKAWPPILPPVLAADASWTDPSVNTPAASANIANFANLFSFFFL